MSLNALHHWITCFFGYRIFVVNKGILLRRDFTVHIGKFWSDVTSNKDNMVKMFDNIRGIYETLKKISEFVLKNLYGILNLLLLLLFIDIFKNLSEGIFNFNIKRK